MARTSNLTVSVNDGYCTSPVRYLYVTVTDENEPPDIQPENAAYSVYEGSVSISFIYLSDILGNHNYVTHSKDGRQVS